MTTMRVGNQKVYFEKLDSEEEITRRVQAFRRRQRQRQREKQKQALLHLAKMPTVVKHLVATVSRRVGR